MMLEFEKFLKAGQDVCKGTYSTSSNMKESYVSSQEEHQLILLNIYTSYLIQTARNLDHGKTFSYANDANATIPQRTREDLMTEATQKLSIAEQIKQLDIMTLVNRGIILLKAYF